MGIDARMFLKTRHPYTAPEIRRLSVDLVEAFGTDVLFVIPPGDFDWHANGRHALEIVPKYEQDGDDVLPEPGELLVEVHLGGCYYGEGYERGAIHEHIAVAQWLEARIPDARIFYGGDSSGVEATGFGAAERAVAFAHFVNVGHRPYHGHFSHGTAPLCGFCQYAMMNYGGGGDREFYGCDGCGQKVVRYKDGEIVHAARGQDFFEIKRPGHDLA